jgi:hypothetical protein
VTRGGGSVGGKMEPDQAPTAEQLRMQEDRERSAPWRRWGPFLAERAWGTVREDYSERGDAWAYFTHDHARSRAYRWSEDGLAGVCDREQLLCLALAVWNGKDPILKERAFGLGGPEGNHGEDVKELYFYEDATPTFSYLRYLYKYPQARFPYDELVRGAQERGPTQPELELPELGVFDHGRYFDVVVEYAKRGPEDILMVITAYNRGREAAPLHLSPQLWFRNTWSFQSPPGERPIISASEGGRDFAVMRAEHAELGTRYLYIDGKPELLFTENETNQERCFGVPSPSPHVKDAFHDAIVGGDRGKLNPARRGSKAAAWGSFIVPAEGEVRVQVRLCPSEEIAPFEGADELVALRRAEADAFYRAVQGPDLPSERRAIHRQASAGLLWSLQFYHYDVDRWLRGDAVPPPKARLHGRNAHWRHLDVADVISMPDTWEYPWFAAWDLAFHAVAISAVDVDLAKSQLKLMVKEWYQHPNGQLPAYEWEFNDLNPPVHAWATYEIYKIERRQRGQGDRVFLERVFHKLLINFAYWVNKQDNEGNNLFEGGFLGLDNISLIDRSEPLPPGMVLEQADATAWMAMYCLDLMRIALELALENSAYEDLASKFFEHFLYISWALHRDDSLAPWNEEFGFYFDILRRPDRSEHVPVRSMVGLIPLFAVHVITREAYAKLDNFRRRTEWFLDSHPWFRMAVNEIGGDRVLTAVPPRKIERVLGQLFDEEKFLSPFGPRSLSKEHASRPVVLHLEGRARPLEVGYEPGESLSRMKGGNSNWRGPVWLPTGYLLYRTLLRLDHGFGDTLRIRGSEAHASRSLREGAHELARRMIALFELDEHGRRPAHGASTLFQSDPFFRDKILFYEYFHGDTGEGLGASHQTGWTALVGDMILRLEREREREQRAPTER